MAKLVSITTGASRSCPVQIHFRCAKCGKDADITRYLIFSTEVTLQGKQARQVGAGQIARARAESDMAETIDWRLESAVRELKHNTASLMEQPYKQPSIFWPPLRCPACGIVNCPDAGCKRRLLMHRAIKWALLTLLVIGGTAACLAALGGPLRLSGPFRLQALYVFLACLAIAAALFLVDKGLSKKAYDDPQLMEKVFGSVLNDAMVADMTPYGFDESHIGSER